MNQHLDTDHYTHSLTLTPDASRSALQATLNRLLVPGNIVDSRLKAYISRLQNRFDLFCTTCPAPQWDRWLIITPEIRCQTELYLPLAEIQPAFRYLLLRACHYKPFLPAVPIFTALSWADAVERMGLIQYNPAEVIAAVAENETVRKKFLAGLFVPKRYGGARDRYPLQNKFLQEWLSEKVSAGISVLDAACGSGEGVYEIAQMIAAAGFKSDSVAVHGCTVESLELAAAAHGWFPNEPDRELAAKNTIGRLATHQGAAEVKFFTEDICSPTENSDRYDLVICNGLLGGPLLHDSNALDAAVGALARKVKKGGILLAADRFHGGWRRVIPLTELKRLFIKNGLKNADLPEGIGAIRT